MTALISPLPFRLPPQRARTPQRLTRLEARWYGSDITPPPPVPETPAPTAPEIPHGPEPVGLPPPFEKPNPVREPPGTQHSLPMSGIGGHCRTHFGCV